MRIALQPTAWKDALEHQEETIGVLKRLDKLPTNYTGLMVEHRFAYGYIGELAVRTALRIRGRKFEHRFDSSGSAGPPDFSVWDKEGFWKGAEVKCAAKPFHNNLAFPAKQKRHILKSHYLIATRCMTDTPADGREIPMSIEGWCTKKTWKNRIPQGPDNRWSIPTYVIPFISLEPIEQLFENLLAAGDDPFEVRQEAAYQQQRKEMSR